MKARQPIRPRNANATREVIIEAARVKFMSKAYEQVGVRDIAAAAGVDPALVHRYFGSKEALFQQVLARRLVNLGAELFDSAGTFGTRVAEGHFNENASHVEHEMINTAIWSAASPVAAKVVAKDIEERFILPIAMALGGDDAEIRASLIMAILMGSSIMRHMLAVRPLAAGDMSSVVPHLAVMLQYLADGRPAR